MWDSHLFFMKYFIICITPITVATDIITQPQISNTNHTYAPAKVTTIAATKVIAIGNNISGQCDVRGWTNIVAVAAGDDHTVGLKADGTVVATGCSYDERCNVMFWTNIIAVSAGSDYTTGLKADGTVVATNE